MYTFALWDKTSPINGIPASEMLGRHSITDSAVGLVQNENGKVCYFQYNNANPYTEEEALAVAERTAAEANNPPPPPYDELEDLQQANDILMGVQA